MRDKKILVMAAWFLMAIVLIGLLVSLLFFSKGLKVEARPAEEFDKFMVTVSNESKHEIHSISVIQENETESKILTTVSKLRPGETNTIRIPVQSSRVILKAAAPFHQTAEHSMFVEPRKPFEISVQAPKTVLIQEKLVMTISICNQNPQTAFEIAETHNPAFFGTNFQTTQLFIPINQCKNAVFEFWSMFTGITAVFFNIKSASFSEQISQEVTVQT